MELNPTKGGIDPKLETPTPPPPAHIVVRPTPTPSPPCAPVSTDLPNFLFLLGILWIPLEILYPSRNPLQILTGSFDHLDLQLYLREAATDRVHKV